MSDKIIMFIISSIIALMVIGAIAGYITNMLYVFDSLSLALSEMSIRMICAVIGLIFFPLGSLHGLYLMLS
jgi:archaellum component FlaG (FlaF/FlaG flagellin family)